MARWWTPLLLLGLPGLFVRYAGWLDRAARRLRLGTRDSTDLGVAVSLGYQASRRVVRQGRRPLDAGGPPKCTRRHPRTRAVPSARHLAHGAPGAGKPTASPRRSSCFPAPTGRPACAGTLCQLAWPWAQPPPCPSIPANGPHGWSASQTWSIGGVGRIVPAGKHFPFTSNPAKRSPDRSQHRFW